MYLPIMKLFKLLSIVSLVLLFLMMESHATPEEEINPEEKIQQKLEKLGGVKVVGNQTSEIKDS